MTKGQSRKNNVRAREIWVRFGHGMGTKWAQSGHGRILLVSATFGNK